jgi:ATP-dependent RNA helicase DHX8/PRP22
MSKHKKKSSVLTPVERMEDMALTAKVSEALSPHLGGLTDKTLSEFVINLTERQIKKKNDGGIESEVAQSQGLRQRLAENGAPEIPLSLCKRLLEWTSEQSPRIKIWSRKQEEKAKKQQKLNGNADNPLSESFPALVKANLNKSVPLEKDFYEHSISAAHVRNPNPRGAHVRDPNPRGISNDPKPRGISSDRNPRGISNLPAWMTKGKEQPPSKKPRRADEEGEPQVHQIRSGRVDKVLDFGIKVSLDGNGGGKEAIVYKSQLPDNRKPRDFKSGQSVRVKVLSISATKIVLSIKDVDQRTGQDLLPHRQQAASQTASKAALSSTAVVHPGLDINALKRNESDSRSKRKRSTKQTLTEQELFEAQQLVRSGVLPVEQYPGYDPEFGMLAIEETEEETEVELNTELEPAFLRGQTKKSGRRDLEPIKIIKNPDGSLQRAAMQQSTLAKERRELRQAQSNQLIDSIPKDLNRPWEDPLPEAGERHFAQELRSINVMSQMDGAPEWKQKIESKTLSYGIISNRSLKEQREGLPIYQLKNELMSAISQNQVLVVIGETGSGKTVRRVLLRATHEGMA